MAAPSPPDARRAVNPWVIAVAVTIATFMEVLDTTIANVALPHIAGDLGASMDDANWVLTSYLVANATSPAEVAKMTPSAYIHGYHVAFFWGAVLLFVGLLVTIFVINAKKQDIPAPQQGVAV